jgi:hypothetical protein
MRNGEFTEKLYLRQTQSCTFTEQEAFDEANSIGLPIDNDGFTYGYVFFRQQRDSQIRRGFFQKALVLLSPHNWPGCFMHILSLVGPWIMDQVMSSRNRSADHKISDLLESTCFEISKW